jgi:CSLREA domain-containing protein
LRGISPMATYTVSTTTDIIDPNDGVLSLREAITAANGTTTADDPLFASGRGPDDPTHRDPAPAHSGHHDRRRQRRQRQPGHARRQRGQPRAGDHRRRHLRAAGRSGSDRWPDAGRSGRRHLRWRGRRAHASGQCRQRERHRRSDGRTYLR